MNIIKEIESLNKIELSKGLTSSWHDDYKESAWIFVGGLNYSLTEGDILTVFSQYGEIEDLHLVRDKESGKSKGFAFVKYEDQRSTVLAVDNFNGITLTGRIIRVDHCKNYRDKRDIPQDGKYNEYILILDGKLSDLSRRRTDNAFILPKNNDTHILNARQDVGGSHIIKRPDGKYERHYTLECSYCCIPIGYTSGEHPKRASTVYIYAKSLSPKQGKYPDKWEKELRELIEIV